MVAARGTRPRIYSAGRALPRHERVEGSPGPAVLRELTESRSAPPPRQSWLQPTTPSRDLVAETYSLPFGEAVRGRTTFDPRAPGSGHDPQPVGCFASRSPESMIPAR